MNKDYEESKTQDFITEIEKITARFRLGIAPNHQWNMAEDLSTIVLDLCEHLAERDLNLGITSYGSNDE